MCQVSAKRTRLPQLSSPLLDCTFNLAAPPVPAWLSFLSLTSSAEFTPWTGSDQSLKTCPQSGYRPKSMRDQCVDRSELAAWRAQTHEVLDGFLKKWDQSPMQIPELRKVSLLTHGLRKFQQRSQNVIWVVALVSPTRDPVSQQPYNVAGLQPHPFQTTPYLLHRQGHGELLQECRNGAILDIGIGEPVRPSCTHDVSKSPSQIFPKF